MLVLFTKLFCGQIGGVVYLFILYSVCVDIQVEFMNDSNFSWATFIGYALPKFAQLTVTSYYAATSASHYGISLLTRKIEEAHTTRLRDSDDHLKVHTTKYA